jgi:hypothetical protein
MFDIRKRRTRLRPPLLIIVVIAALFAAATADAATSTGIATDLSVRNVMMQPASSHWCGQTYGGNRQYRIKAHNLTCSATRRLASNYASTGRYPRGYFCAADIFYCWTAGHVHWFRGFLITAPPTPPPPPPPPTSTVGTRSNPFPLGSTAQDARWTFRVNSVNWDAWPVVQAANMFNVPPPAGYVDVMASLTAQYIGPGTTTIIDFSTGYGVVGSDGILRYSFTGATCGVLPSPQDIDYSTFFSGATFDLNDCWVVPVSQLGSLELYWNDVEANASAWWALR